MSELPSDLDPGELDAMVRDLGHEHEEMPDWVYPPDLVESDHVPQHIFGFNRGCTPDGLETYKEGQKWRRRLIAELAQSPEWIAEWRAARDLNRRIEALCERRNLTFRPWEIRPWRAPDELPQGHPEWSNMHLESLPQAVKLRRQLIAELEAEDARKPAQTSG
jgi:hypothetical protein